MKKYIYILILILSTTFVFAQNAGGNEKKMKLDIKPNKREENPSMRGNRHERMERREQWREHHAEKRDRKERRKEWRKEAKKYREHHGKKFEKKERQQKPAMKPDIKTNEKTVPNKGRRGRR